MKISIVVPTIRKEQIETFLVSWENEFAGHQVIVVEDNPQKSFVINNAEHYSWEEIDKELGKQSWIIPRRTDCIRSFGIWKAYQSGADYIVTLDDDCRPLNNNFLSEHCCFLDRIFSRWLNTIVGIKARGVPYFNRGVISVMLNVGFWHGVPDVDAPTQLTAEIKDFEPNILQPVAKGMYFPMSGMNVAWRRELTPAMYWLLMGKDYPYDRFGDIWCGIIVKKICDHLGFAITAGTPAVKHERASNVWKNLAKEALGLEINETFWQIVDKIKLTKRTVKDCYKEVAQKLDLSGDYWNKLKEAMTIWAEMF